MSQPFIQNHQYNLIRKHVHLLRHACGTVSDPKVVASVRQSALAAIDEMFPETSAEQREALGQLAGLHTAEQFQSYLRALEPYRLAFEPVTETQLKKLFPKVKKLKVPDLAALDGRGMTYLGWTDIASGKGYLVYRIDGRLIGIEGRLTPVNKKSYCFLCNRQEEVALFSAVTKSKPPNASPDYYKAISQYLCADSAACNGNIADVAALEKFVRTVGV